MLSNGFTRFLSRLGPRIYVIGVAQIVIVVLLTMVTLLTIGSRPPVRFDDIARFMGTLVTQSARDPAALQRLVENLQSNLRASTALYDESGRLVVSAPDISAASQAEPSWSSAVEVVEINVPDRGTWHLAFIELPQPPPVLMYVFAAVVVVAIGLSSVWVARWLGHPLGQLATAAREFGAGRLNTRLELGRSDEFGDVARAFNQMAERLAQALRGERELLANVSHELRTPLQRIHIALELAVEGDAAHVREFLEDIAQDLAELGRVLDDVLTAARLSLADEASTRLSDLPIRVAPCGLESLLHASQERFRANHTARPLELSITGEFPDLMMDGMLIRRAIDNLLENAHKYTDEPGAPIVLAARSSGPRVIVEVRDRGIGIASDDLPRIFEPFFRTDRSRNRKTGGIGLGLTLARRIIEVHGGRLTLQSTLGVGTCARIELPFSQRAVPLTASSRPA